MNIGEPRREFETPEPQRRSEPVRREEPVEPKREKEPIRQMIAPPITA
jgi:hypothetical protein